MFVAAKTIHARILVVEDEAELAAALQAALQGDYAVDVARDGPTATRLLEQTRYDVVLLDLILPRGTGLSILETLSALGHEAPRVIAMSALVDAVDLSAFAHLVVGRLTKPFGLSAARERLREALAGRRTESRVQGATAQGAAVLVVDDDETVLESMAAVLRTAGHTVQTLQDAERAVDMVRRGRFDVVLCDLIMPGISGVDLVEQIRQVSQDTPVVLMSGYSTPELTRRALTSGAADVLSKPLTPATMLTIVEKCLLQRRTVPAATPVRRAGGKQTAGGKARYAFADIAGDSEAISRARQALIRAAAYDCSVLLRGETGTGKELFAQALHQLSPRARGPFVAINAAAIPESLLESELFGYAPGSFTGARKDGHQGKFVKAHGGTIFLDEIGDLPLPLQSKLLRVLQEGEVDQIGGGTRRIDVRVVAATHRDLRQMAHQGSFRSDLYYRLNVVSIELPPLRERGADIALLADRYLRDLGEKYHRPGTAFSGEALRVLQEYAWPGNIRELRNVVEQVFALTAGTLFEPEHLPPAMTAPQRQVGMTMKPAVGAGYPLDMASSEREAIQRALEATGGNKLQAAHVLGISRAGLYNKLKQYGLP